MGGARRRGPRLSGCDASDGSGLTPHATINTMNDHRMAMCFSLAALAACAINDPKCVAKTFPDYFDFADITSKAAVPVVAMDGPSASGKGTVARQVAADLGFHFLDSGALYRLEHPGCAETSRAMRSRSPRGLSLAAADR